ncbi:MAG: hypothetical protein U9N59_13830 [Campylobacterota bacterium]|nr:hypothetical protein [Campylobacterota bacterium]
MSTDILLSNEVIIFLFIESILLFTLFIAIYFIVAILKNWNFNSTTSAQYQLEKQSYLVTVIIYFTLIVKIFLVPYFTYTVDILSAIVPGAMCGAGVISSNDFGENLLVLKIILLFFISFWLIINKLDIEKKNFPYLKKKFLFFIIIFLFIILEFTLDILYFTDISTLSIATCCSAIYSSDGSINPLPLGLNLNSLLILFYLLYIMILISNIKQNQYLSALLNVSFLYISYYAILYFFGTYVYELPTHHCPFCMLQKDYSYIGYVIFITLFLGTFFGIINFILTIFTKGLIVKYYKYSNIFNTLFVLTCSLYVVSYYIRNGVFL